MGAHEIVVIDDDPHVLKILKGLLTHRGYSCDVYEDPRIALQRVLNEIPDAVIVDLAMPGIDGVSFCTEVRAQLGASAPPVLMLSGNIDETSIEAALEAGAVEFMRKPVLSAEIYAKIRHAISTHKRAAVMFALGLAGDRIGPYKVLERLGRGGMGVVYKVMHVDYTLPMALKTLKLEEARMGQGVRFKREVDLLTDLEHPNLVRVFDVGQTESVLYYVMEFVEGGTLRDLIRRNGRVAPVEVARLLLCMADALDYLHGHSLLHRDIKPGNILISTRRGPVLADFGIAKDLLASDETQTNALVGTPYYMAPEMIDNRKLDGRCDLFALGMVGIEMLLGRRGLPSEHPVQTSKRILEGDFPKASELPDVPAPLAKVVDRLLEVEPDSRYALASELRVDLEPFVRESLQLDEGDSYRGLDSSLLPQDEMPTPVPG